jgi:hypothetical protein
MRPRHRSPSPVDSSPAPLRERRLSPDALDALDRASVRWSARFGVASRAELEASASAALTELGASSELAGPALAAEAERRCAQLERAHEARFGRTALAAELADDRARARARSSGSELLGYQRAWERTLARLQRAHPQRWCVPGLSDDEVRDAITLRLIELVVAPPGGEPPRGRPGKRWGLCLAQRELGVLRRSFRLAATPTDFTEAAPHDRAPNQEDACIELEADRQRALAEQRAEQQLSRPQRRWLDAMRLAASAGEFFASSNQLNLSAASRELGRNRSSAQRAYQALQARFQRELGRVG